MQSSPASLTARLAWSLAALLLVSAPGFSRAEAQTCTTQSQMQPADRAAVGGAALKLAQSIQAGESSVVQASTIPEYAGNFAAVAEVIASTAPLLKAGHPQVEQIYILDASTLKAPGDTQFYCTLNHSQAEADFSIPQLPPGRYAFAMVRFDGAAPYRLSFLLLQAAGRWLMAGVYPKPLDAAGHDGLWFWIQARQFVAAKQPWNAWLYLQEAQNLLQPARFVSSTHLDKLATELASATPPEAKNLGPQAPLVVKAADGTEFRFTALVPDDSLGKEKIDVAAHLKVDALGDATAARQRNLAAMAALVSAHPELRSAFHGVWIFAEAPNQSPYATEGAMSEIH
jgi:hypothetical protein